MAIKFVITSCLYFICVSASEYYPNYHNHHHYSNFYPNFQQHYTNPLYFGGGGLQQSGYFDRSFYDDENKASHGDTFEKSHGNRNEAGHHDAEGHVKGLTVNKDVNGDAGFYGNEEGGSKRFDNGKSHQGQQHYSESGNDGGGENQKSNHKKGHSKKGFKISHHKDETGVTETYYDEEHDEGDKHNFQDKENSFAKKEQSSHSGNQKQEQFDADVNKKQGHFEHEHIVDNNNVNKGQYGRNEQHGNGETYSFNHGIGQQSLLGRQEANRMYLNHHPHGYVPFYPGYK